MTICNATHYDNPGDCMPMRCSLGLGHDGDHQPTSHGGEAWTTWPNTEGAA